MSVVFSAAAFLTLDWLRSAAIQRAGKSTVKSDSCRIPDQVLHHALKPNCAFTDQWGGNKYDYFTNSLGFRDEQIRDVPLTEVRPRILILGNSFTEGQIAWRDSYVGKIAAHFPQYEFLNGGLGAYSPSNYLNVARLTLAKGVDIDEAIVFIGIEDVQFEAAFYRDVDASGAVAGPEQVRWISPLYTKSRLFVARHFMLSYYLLGLFERFLVGHGYYHLTTDYFGNAFDREGDAWTYRKVDEADPFPSGYAPLGVEGGIAKDKAKMTLLWQELQARNIPLSVVVYPYPAQLAHDTADSRQVRLWRDWCAGKCSRFISLFQVFSALKEQCPRSQPGCWYLRLFIFEDNHYNAAGNTLVADEVIKALAAEPPSKRLAARLRPGSVQENAQSLRAHVSTRHAATEDAEKVECISP